MPELGRDRVLDRQRVDVARRQREHRGEDAADDLGEKIIFRTGARRTK